MAITAPETEQSQSSTPLEQVPFLGQQAPAWYSAAGELGVLSGGYQQNDGSLQLPSGFDDLPSEDQVRMLEDAMPDKYED